MRDNVKRKRFVFLFAALFHVICAGGYCSAQERGLIFSDEFSGGEIDTSVWSLSRKARSNWACCLSDDPGGIVVQDGLLSLRAVWDYEQNRPVTWGLESRGKFSFDYGEIEVRARFTQAGKGAWPAIWLMPQNPAATWPACGEIDIMERIDDDREVWQTVHMSPENADRKNLVVRVQYDTLIDPYGFNIYGVKKMPGRLEFTVNGRTTLVIDRDSLPGAQWPFEGEWYIILNHACADTGESGREWWPETVDDPAALPYRMDIDYVRVYELSE